MKLIYAVLLFITFNSCTKNNTETETPPAIINNYFPPISSDAWETTTAASLGWDTAKLKEAVSFAGSTNTYGLIILYKGRIVTENYWNNWNKDTRYPIASAGKSVVAFLTGKAQEEGLLNINAPTSTYLGTGWTSLPPAKEAAITVRHQLTMTTGLDDGAPDDNCTTPACLTYKAGAGDRWAYHNAPYRLLQDVIAKTAGINFNQYTKTRLSDKIGLKNWSWYNYTIYLNTRDMARFGLLIENNGQWNSEKIMTDAAYFGAMTNTSQQLNKSYGYLWWLNGKPSYLLPGLQTTVAGSMAPDAPADLLMALGKDDKKIYVVPSLDLVVVQHGDDAGGSAAGPSSFDNAFWAKLRLAIKGW